MGFQPMSASPDLDYRYNAGGETIKERRLPSRRTNHKRRSGDRRSLCLERECRQQLANTVPWPRASSFPLLLENCMAGDYVLDLTKSAGAGNADAIPNSLFCAHATSFPLLL
jgi:hypothetical protein